MAEGTLTVGKVQILALTDTAGAFAAFAFSSMFPGVRPEQWQPFRERYPETFAGELCHLHVGSYLVRSGGRTILIDTGIGPAPATELFGDARGRLMEEMKANNVTPDEIDVVFITHAHFDHVGWNLTSEGKLTFRNARYMLGKADWEALPQLQAAVPPYIDTTLTPLERLGAVDLLTGETSLTPEVVALPAPGHTPGHMCVLISSGGEKAMIMGDALVHPAMVTEPDWGFSFDSLPEVAVSTRKQLLDRLEGEGMIMAQCHFPNPGFGRIVRLEGRRYWQRL